LEYHAFSSLSANLGSLQHCDALLTRTWDESHRLCKAPRVAAW